jgi:hypothetical protein
MKEKIFAIILGCFMFVPCSAFADMITFDDGSGLSATADFSYSGSTLTIALTNTSTALPSGFSNSDQLLTSIGFDFNGGLTITGGSVVVGAGSTAFFDSGNLFGGADVSSEWGFGNANTTTGFAGLDNVVSAMQSSTVSKGGSAFAPDLLDLDGPSNLNGPQGGLTNGLLPLGGLGAIDNSGLITLSLSGVLGSLDFLTNGVVVEFGSDAHFINTVPEPTTIALLGIGLAGLAGAEVRRRRKKKTVDKS